MARLDGFLLGECATWLSIVSQLYTTRMNALLAPHGLTLAQFGILHHIARPEMMEGARVSDIAAAVEVGQPAVTKALARFEAQGLVEFREHPQDRRAKIVRARGQALRRLDEVRQSIGGELFAAFGAVDEGDIEAFARALRALGQWLDRNRIATAPGSEAAGPARGGQQRR